MRGFPQGLVPALVLALVLIFGAWLLVRSLYRHWRRQAATMAGPPGSDAALRTAAPAPAADAPVPAGAAAVPTGAPHAAPRGPTPVRRGTRAALFPHRRALRSAIVACAILQPCHANRARDVD